MSVNDGEFAIVWTDKVKRAELFCVPQSSFFLRSYFNIVLLKHFYAYLLVQDF